MPHETFQQSEELFELIEEGIDRGCYIFMADLEEDYSRLSKNLVRDFNLPSNYMYEFDKQWCQLIHPQDVHLFVNDFERIMTNQSDTHDCSYRIMNTEGRYIWLNCKGSVIRKEGKPHMFCGCITNMQYTGKYDSITSLLNIDSFQQDLINIFLNQKEVSVLALDIRNFSSYNERYTHVFGDKMLSVFAQELINEKFRDCMIYRLNGDRFCVLIEGTSKDRAVDVFNRINNIAKHKCYVGGHQVSFSIRGGVSFIPTDAADADMVHRNIESVLADVKENARKELVFFDDEILQNSLRQTQLMEELRTSIHNDFQGFSAEFQPIFHEEHIVSCEVLLRYHCDHFGDVCPYEFIPVLESEESIIEVGKWVLHSGLSCLEHWQKVIPNICMNFNISFIQMLQNNFLSDVMSIVDQYNINKNSICFELTENCKLIDEEVLSNNINKLKDCGITTVLDDFGGGYASMEVLRYIDVNIIKIDHRFISSIIDDDVDEKYLDYLLELCKELNLQICVEGVESEQVANLIKPYKPSYVQGFLYAKPSSAKEFEKDYITAR